MLFQSFRKLKQTKIFVSNEVNIFSVVSTDISALLYTIQYLYIRYLCKDIEWNKSNTLVCPKDCIFPTG